MPRNNGLKIMPTTITAHRPISGMTAAPAISRVACIDGEANSAADEIEVKNDMVGRSNDIDLVQCSILCATPAIQW